MVLDPKIIALAIITSDSYEEARSKLKIGRTKFWQLRQQDDVKIALTQLSARFYEEALARAMSDTKSNMTGLKTLATGDFEDSQKAFVQLAAYKYLLEIAHKGYELKTLNERIERLENTINVTALP